MEILNRRPADADFRAAIFDFDGTLSLFRRNWHEVMLPMMVDVLAAAGASESPQELHQLVEDFVMQLNGRQTIYQMIRLADEIRKRGGEPQDPLVYKHRYHDLLWVKVKERVRSVTSGEVDAEQLAVPGAHALLQALMDRGVTLYLASGTDIDFVRDELAALGMAGFFGSRVYGALDDYTKFSKAMIIQQIFAETNCSPSELVGFGDGFVEIEEVRKAGGYAIGVASNEDTRTGVNAWKRERLVRAGADAIIGDYRDLRGLLELLRLRTS